MSLQPLLFSVPDATPMGERDAKVDVEFGEIAWGCGSPPSSQADGAWSYADGRIFVWDRPPFHIELALINSVPKLPEGLEIRDSWIGYWRLITDTDALAPHLTCSIARSEDEMEGGGDSGEALAAQTWENTTHRLTIGTEDSEALEARAGQGVPPAWRADLLAWEEAGWRRWMRRLRAGDGTTDPVSYSADGVTLVLPPVPARVVCEFHHAAAWQRVGEGEDASTWFAVDLIRSVPAPAFPA